MRSIFMLAVASLVLAGTCIADTINVPGDYPTIQQAVDAAVDGDEIIVGPGTYSDGNEYEVVKMGGKAVWLHSSDGPEATIIDGGGVRRGIACVLGEGPGTIIEGFTIRNCDDGPTQGVGGGIIVASESSPIIRGCIIRDNTAFYGGGIGLDLRSSPVIEDCLFEGNDGEYGGGFASVGGAGNGCNSVLRRCEFVGNTAKDGGGAYFEHGISEIVDCQFSVNSSTDEGGGVHVSYDSEVSISDCYISNNSSGVDPGGGIWNGLGGSSIVGGTTVCANSPGQIHGSWTDAGGNVVSEVCPVTWTVALDGSGDFTAIKDAVAASSSGDLIMVMPGTYLETDITAQGKAITIEGSLADDGSLATIVDAQEQGRVFRFSEGEGGDTVLRNLVVANGRANDGDAGGVYCNGTSPTVQGCLFVNNSSVYDGGAVAVLQPGAPTFVNCTFSGNEANKGGAMLCWEQTNVTLSGCLFEGNHARNNEGGAIYLWNCAMVMEDSSFVDNWANGTGGGLFCSVCDVVATDVVIQSNDAAVHGGGIAIYDTNSDWTLNNCQIAENTAGTDGAGVYSASANTAFDHCVIKDNVGAWGSGLYFTGLSVSAVSNTLVSGNVSTFRGGGVLCVDSSDVSVIDSSITSNTAPDGGAGIYNPDPDVTLSLEGTFVCSNNPDQIQGNYIDDGGNTIENVCSDSDADGVPDAKDNCYLYNPDQLDCNGNGIGDVCDLADQNSLDCDQNGVPDECDPDCDGDGVIDGCESDPDFDQDGIPDNCEPDCNENTIPDDYEVEQGWAADCNSNGVPDECDLLDLGLDCDDNGLIDSCEIADDPTLDCDENGVLDACDPLDDTTDCDGNGAIDACELIDDPSLDCNMNGIIDSCDLADDPTPDCDGNGLFDSCEIEENPDLDCDGSGILDTCELVYNYVERAKVLASDGDVEDNFGISISMDGDLALVGARNQDDQGSDSGSVYIFERTGDGSWQEVGQFYGSDTVEGDVFGVGVSLDGDQAAVGASGDDGNGSNRAGSVYIFEREASGAWIEVAKINAPPGLVDAAFGDDVSLDGERILIGATIDDELANNAGSAFIYERNAEGEWIEQAKLLASDGQSWHYFGSSVSLEGDTAMVTAPKYDSDTGVIYEFARQADGSWLEVGQIFLSDGVSGDVLGQDIQLIGDRMMASTYRDGGFIQVFKRAAGGDWTEVERIVSSDLEPGDSFGRGLTFQGNTLLAAAEGDTNDGGEGAGAFYVFALTSDLDCDANKIIDSCEITADPSLDCDDDSVLDSCALIDELVADCDENDIPDSCDIDADPLLDQNENGLLDDCECLADVGGGGDIGDGDGVVDVNDILILIGLWGTAGPIGDLNFDDVVDVNDLLLMLEAWGQECDD